MCLYFGNMAIANGRMQRCVRAQDRVLGRRDRNLGHRPKAFNEKIARCSAVVSPICEKLINGTINLIQQIWKCSRIANIIRGQIGTDDLAADKIKAEVQLAPTLSFGLVFMLLLKLFAHPKDLKPGAVNNQLHRFDAAAA
jgi:hypothetical protein